MGRTPGGDAHVCCRRGRVPDQVGGAQTGGSDDEEPRGAGADGRLGEALAAAGKVLEEGRQLGQGAVARPGRAVDDGAGCLAVSRG